MRLFEEILCRVYLKKDKRHLIITPKLVNEIRKTQDLIRRKAKNKKKNQKVSILHASDFIAEVYRQERFKIMKK